MTTQLSEIVTTILKSEKNINQKTQELAKLNELYKHYAGIEFLNSYCQLYKNNSIETISPKDIARILSLFFPLNNVEFVELIQKNQQDIKPIIESFSHFSEAFPLYYTQVTEYFALPLLFTTILHGDKNDSQIAFTLNKSFFNSTKFANEFIFVFKKLFKQNNNSIYKLHQLFPNYFNMDVIKHLIKNEFSDFDFLDKILLDYNLDNKESYSVDLFKFNSSFYNSIAIHHLLTNSYYSKELFQHFAKKHKYSLKDTIELRTTNYTLIDFITTYLKSKDVKAEAVYDLFNKISIHMDEVDLMFMFRHYISNDFKSFIQICSTPFFQQLINHPLIDSHFFNKSELMQSLFDLEIMPEYIKYLKENNIFIKPAIVILNTLIQKYPNEFDKLALYKAFFIKKNESAKVLLDLDYMTTDIQLLVKKSILNSMDYIVQQDIEELQPINVKSLQNIGFITVKNNYQKNGIFSKGTETQTYVWNIDFMQKSKNNIDNTKSNNNIDFFSFLVGDNGKPLSFEMIEVIKSEETKKIAKNIVLMAYQFNDLKLEYLSNEEFFFMSQQLGKMVNRLLDTYKDYKNYDLDVADKTLHTQMLMLQKKTTEAIDVVLYEDKNRLKIDTKINNYFVNKKLNNSDE